MQLQCYICGNTIRYDLKQSHKLDPCEVVIESNCNLNNLDRRVQTFWCHFDCFKSIMYDSLLLELDEGVASKRELLEEEYDINQNLEQLLKFLKNNNDFLTILFYKPKGIWYRLIDLIPTNKSFIEEVNEVENKVFDTIMVSWMTDERFKESDRLIALSTDCNYENYATIQIKHRDL